MVPVGDKVPDSKAEIEKVPEVATAVIVPSVDHGALVSVVKPVVPSAMIVCAPDVVATVLLLV